MGKFFSRIYNALIIMAIISGIILQPAFAQTDGRAEVLASDPLPALTVSEADVYLGAIYGATRANGTFYAGIGERLAVLSGPANRLAIVWKSELLDTSSVNRIEASGNTLLVGTYTTLYLFDISQPLSPRKVGQVNTSAGNLVIFDHYALAGTYDVNVIDWSDVTNPKIIATINESNTTMIVDQKMAYFQSYNGLKIYDLADPANPKLSGSFTTTGYYSGNSTMDVNNGIAMVTTWCHLWMLDVSVPSAIRVLADVPPENNYCIFSGSQVVIDGTIAYVVDGNAITAYNISQPDHPYRMDSYATENLNNGLDYSLFLKYVDGWLILTDGTLNVIQIPQAFSQYNNGSFGRYSIQDIFEDGTSLNTLSRRQVRILTRDSSTPDLQFTELGSFTQTGIFSWNENPTRIVRQGNFIYLVGVNYDSKSFGIWILNAADPKNIFLAGKTSLTLESAHSLQVSSVAIQGAILYASLSCLPYDTNKCGSLLLFNISNPAAIVSTGGLDFDENINCLAVIAGFAFLGGDSSLSVINISNPQAPLLDKEYAEFGGATAIGVNNNHLFLSNKSLTILDISAPKTPLLSGLTKIGVNSNQLFIQGNLLYTNSSIFDVSDITSPRLVEIYPQSFSEVLILGNELLGFTGAEIHLLHTSPAIIKVLSSLDNQLFSSQDQVRYTIYPGCLSGDIALKHTPKDRNIRYLPGGTIRHFSVAAWNENGSWMCSYQIQIQFSAQELSLYDESTLKLVRWDGRTWVQQMVGTMDLPSHTLTIPMYTGGEFAVFGLRTSNLAKTYLPSVSIPQPSIAPPVLPLSDLTINPLEVTQGVQNPAQSVPLVAGRRTVLRIYPLSGRAEPVDSVSITVEGYRNNAPLPGSPFKIGPWAVFSSTSRRSYSQADEVILPQEWTTAGATKILLTIDPDNQIAESNETNNSRELWVTFNTVPILGITLVPVNFHTPSGTIIPAVKLTPSDGIDQMMPLYPINGVTITIHPTLDWSGDLSKTTEWNRYLDFITSLKNSEHAPAKQVYYGLVPISYPNMAYGGLGWMNQRASVGYLGALAHEVGHNFNLPHAPCGTSGDANYPYPNALIGQDALDVYSFSIKDALVYHDLMSYCGPGWFSDYNYIKLYNKQRQVGAQQQALVDGPGLLVRAKINSGGGVEWQPFYELDGAVPEPISTNSPYRLELVDEAGITVSSQAVDLFEEAEGAKNQGFFALLPLQGFSIGKLRLWKADQVIGEYSAAGTTQSSQVVELTQEFQGLHLNWGSGVGPVILRYRPLGDTDWITVGIDVDQLGFELNRGNLPSGKLEFEVIPAGLHGQLLRGLVDVEIP
jgi:hypothetical protein